MVDNVGWPRSNDLKFTLYIGHFCKFSETNARINEKCPKTIILFLRALVKICLLRSTSMGNY